jgi:hypothetical protein
MTYGDVRSNDFAFALAEIHPMPNGPFVRHEDCFNL